MILDLANSFSQSLLYSWEMILGELLILDFNFTKNNQSKGSDGIFGLPEPFTSGWKTASKILMLFHKTSKKAYNCFCFSNQGYRIVRNILIIKKGMKAISESWLKIQPQSSARCN